MVIDAYVFFTGTEQNTMIPGASSLPAKTTTELAIMGIQSWGGLYKLFGTFVPVDVEVHEAKETKDWTEEDGLYRLATNIALNPERGQSIHRMTTVKRLPMNLVIHLAWMMLIAG